MGQNKRATRKELEKVVGQIIGEITNLRNGFQALDGYIGAYVEWKNDRPKFEEHLSRMMKEKQFEINDKKEPMSNDKKDTKKSRYEKVSELQK
tara:strand:- start:308 stop:586 length:279 start_codon:yes stop_codon:yes gene_type:complete